MYSPEVIDLLRRLVVVHNKRVLVNPSVKPRATKLTEDIWPEYHACPFYSTRSGWEEELSELAGLGVIECTACSGVAPLKVSIKSVEAARQLAGLAEPELPYRRQWASAVESAFEDCPAEQRAVIARHEVSVPGKTAQEVANALARLPRYQGMGLSLREVSARVFWGDSKVLDARQLLVAAVLGVQECPFPCSPVVLNVKLCQQAKGVLFIENLDTFEKLCRSPSAYHLVYASGFRASAKRVRTREGSTVYFHAQSDFSRASEFLEWLYQDTPEMDVFLWGDLDWAGMSILKASREAFPTMRAWTPGYELMMSVASSGSAHTLDMAGKSGQNVVEAVGCPYADEQVLTFLRSHQAFLDQEAVDATALALA